jgi:hypothetical protein
MSFAQHATHERINLLIEIFLDSDNKEQGFFRYQHAGVVGVTTNNYLGSCGRAFCCPKKS